MAETVDMKIIHQHAENVYEAIIMTARRARQINDEQHLIREREAELEDSSDFDDEEFETFTPEEPRLSLPKPHTLAMQEFLQGELVREYVEDSA